MADSTIIQLPQIDTITNEDYFVAYDTSTSATKKTSGAQIFTKIANVANQNIIAPSAVITGREIDSNSSINVTFTGGITATNTTTPLTINYNEVDIPVKVGKNGSLVSVYAHETSSGVYKYLQAYTNLELVYDGTQFIIVGNPILLSSAENVVHANGNDKKNGIMATTARFLRFNPTNKKGLIIKKNTSITVGNYTFVSFIDTAFDLSEYLTVAGADYFVYLNCNSDNLFTLSASTTKSADTDTSRYIGRVHTLCASVGDSTTMIMPCNTDASVGDSLLVKPYREDTDPDFYAFYNKTVSAVEAGARASGVVQGPFYNIATVPHPLAGFEAGDILPESIWCLTWHPDTRYEDAMVYDVATGIAVDVYLQSGTGADTRSAYNKIHTVTRPQSCFVQDMAQVGKQLLSNGEFTSAAIGSNECTNIVGSSDKTTVGGHSDTASRRMVSAIGCEEMCGYLWQVLRDVAPLGTGTGFTNIDNSSGHNVGNTGVLTEDGQNKFGLMYNCIVMLLTGGNWHAASSCGSCCRYAYGALSNVGRSFGARGSSQISQNA